MEFNSAFKGLMCIDLQVSRPFLPSDFNITCKFCDKFSKNTQIQNFVQICPVRAEFFHADRQTDTTKIIVVFRNFAKAPKNVYKYLPARSLSFY